MSPARHQGPAAPLSGLPLEPLTGGFTLRAHQFRASNAPGNLGDWQRNRSCRSLGSVWQFCSPLAARNLGQPAQRERPAHKVPPAPKVLKACKVRRNSRPGWRTGPTRAEGATGDPAQKATKATSAPWDQRAQPVQRAQRVQKVTKERSERLARWSRGSDGPSRAGLPGLLALQRRFQPRFVPLSAHFADCERRFHAMVSRLFRAIVSSRFDRHGDWFRGLRWRQEFDCGRSAFACFLR